MYNPIKLQFEVNVSSLPENLIGNILHTRGLKLAAAESCTGGLIGNRITDVVGSSEYFLGSIVAYAYEVKVKLLDVSWNTLNKYGAVSRETVLEMARGVQQRIGSDVAISVSGIAGPGGGTPEKPVGTTWIGLIAKDGEWPKEFHFSGIGEQNKLFAQDPGLQMYFVYFKRRS